MLSEGPRMPKFSQLFPIVSTSDMKRALAFYRDLLGATVTYEFPAPDGTLAYAGLEIGSSHLGMGLATQAASEGGRTISLWVYTDDCDAAVARMREAGVRIVEEPADQPWGERVARVLDPDGNELIIGQVIR
jgi:lactoylglutathione lyase